MQQITHSIFPGYEWEKIVSMFEKVAVILLLTVLGSLLLKVFEIQVWRHDAIMMFSDYFWKMRAEGRWINYFIFPLLQNVNPHFSIVVAEICVFYFAYVVAIRLISFKRIAFLFALLACQLPSLYSIIGWPITVMPSFLALAFFAYVSNKVQPSVVFILGGIVFFGLFNNFYNLLLLLYVGKISHSNIKKGISLLFLWVVSYLIGYIFMLCVCKVLTGDWGLAIESWRKPNPIHSYSDLIDTITYIDSVYTIDNVNMQLIPVIIPFVKDDPIKSTIKRIKTLYDILKRLSSDEYYILRGYITKLADTSAELSYKIPAAKCTECDKEIPENTETSASDLLFTRHHLGAFANM